jgi:hypothetical protein
MKKIEESKIRVREEEEEKKEKREFWEIIKNRKKGRNKEE